MDPLDDILTSLVDSAFPVMEDRPDDPDCLPLPYPLNPVVYGRREEGDRHGERYRVLPL